MDQYLKQLHCLLGFPTRVFVICAGGRLNRCNNGSNIFLTFVLMKATR